MLNLIAYIKHDLHSISERLQLLHKKFGWADFRRNIRDEFEYD